MFAELFQIKKNCAKEQQQNARVMFPALVNRAKKIKLYTSELKEKVRSYTVIGVATFSADDMKLLDEIEEKLLPPFSQKNDIYVIDLVNCKYQKYERVEFDF